MCVYIWVTITSGCVTERKRKRENDGDYVRERERERGYVISFIAFLNSKR